MSIYRPYSLIKVVLLGRARGDKRTERGGAARAPVCCFLCAHRAAALTQHPGGSARLRPLRVPLLGSVSVPGALGSVAAAGAAGGTGRRRRRRVGHPLDQRGATDEEEDILREMVR